MKSTTMNLENFNQLLEDRFEKTRNILIEKNKEYGLTEDVLHSFREQADFSVHNTGPSVCWELMVKHLYSVRRMVKDFEVTGMPPTEELMNEKIGDTINYLILLEAMFKEIQQ
jgi:hypothetical protein